MSPRVPPQAVEVEKHVLGGLMLDPEAVAIASQVLKPQDFYLEKYRLVYEACLALSEKRVPVDLITVSQELKTSGKFQQVTEATLMEISNEVVSSANMEAHCHIIREKARLRELIGGYVKALEMVYDGGNSIDEILAHNEAMLMEQSKRVDAGELVPPEVYIPAAMQEFQVRTEGKPQGIQTGIKDLDKVLVALKGSTVTIIGAGPGMGKSALVLQLAKNCKDPVALFTLEMLMQEQVERMIAQEDGRLDSYALADKFQLERHAGLIAQIAAKLKGLPIWMNESSTITPPEILRQCRTLQRKHGLGLVIVDYLQLVEANGKFETREREVSYVSKYLKRIANELRVPLVAVASLSRSAEKREDRRPLLSDLRETGQIDYDAHKVIFIYRDEIYHACEENTGVAEILIRKNKGGMLGMVPVAFRDKQTRFYDMDKDAKDAYLEFIGKKNRKGSSKPPPPTEPPPDVRRSGLPQGDW